MICLGASQSPGCELACIHGDHTSRTQGRWLGELLYRHIFQVSHKHAVPDLHHVYMQLHRCPKDVMVLCCSHAMPSPHALLMCMGV